MGWEYLYDETDVGEGFQPYLTKMGDEGWDLTSVTQGMKPMPLIGSAKPVWICIWKRTKRFKKK